MSRHLCLVIAAAALVAAPLAARAASGPEHNTEFSSQGLREQLLRSHPALQQQQQRQQGRPAGPPAGRPAHVPQHRPAGPPPGRPAFAPHHRPAGPPPVAHRPFAPRFAAPVPAPRHVAPPQYRRQHVAPGYVAPNYATPRYAAPPAARYGGRGVNYIRGPHYVHRHGMARRLAAVTALSALAIGSRYYYPYAYVPLAERTCYGVTPEGCELDWADVPTVDGDVIEQCVAYCPR